jgi:hypothetical protein
MKFIKATIYDPPDPAWPYLAVLIGTDGQVTGARAFDTAELAEVYLMQIMPELDAEIGRIRRKDMSSR